jgi:hypothetical protein
MSDAERNDLSVAMSIAERIKEIIAGLRRDRISELIRQHLEQFRLIDSTGRWQAEELAALGDWLLGEELDTDDALELVDEVARCAGANPWLAANWTPGVAADGVGGAVTTGYFVCL